MRIGVALSDERGMAGDVCMHFGQCSHFLIVNIVNGAIADTTIVPNTAVHGGGGCVAVDEILKQNVTHVISGGMGMGAQQKFASGNVKIFGYTGPVKDGINLLLKNALSGIAACSEHGDCH